VARSLLGFDFGRKRIGIAVGQKVTGTATALCTLTSGDDRPDWDAISRLIGEWRPDALVVGLPLHADGSESEMSRAARKFARQLEARYRLPVHTMDERLSSHTAAEQQRREDRQDRAGIDAIAARIILQNWLEQADP
jgi:putative Holliday junction resolvase